MDFGDEKARYELTEATEKVPHHHHLVCIGCGKVIDYNEFAEKEKELIKQVEKELSKKYKFEIKKHIVNFYGICNKCKERR
ncbi:MAG: Fur family transcriptional regulator [Candidatus Ratteibacteria bacterium]